MKLQFKLIIAFAGTVIIMGLLQSLFFQQRVKIDFENYLIENESERVEALKELFIGYYLYFGTLEGVQGILDDTDVQNYLNDNNTDNRPRKGYMGGNNFLLTKFDALEVVVANNNGTVLGSTDEKWLGENTRNIPGTKQDLIVEGEKIGEIIIYKEKSMGFVTLEQKFIDSIKISIALSMIISVIVAVIIGILLSNKITKPLEKLMIGIRNISRGDTSYRVEVDTEDEFSQLADAFNDMSKKLKKNEDVRRTLVADVAHELRTPLAILGGRLESIQEGALEPSQEVILQLNDEVYRLTRLVNDLQQLGLAEAGKLPLTKTNVNLNELIQRVIYHLNWLAEEKNIKIIYNLEENIEVLIDSDRITQVIINILGNALRHTPNDGEVILELTRNHNEDKVYIRISDSGPGIDEEHLPYVFERFYRTDTSRTRDKGGTGLGLSIAKGFVETHGGSITVESTKGKGTIFIISLPIK